MISSLLGVLALLGSGVVSGVMFAVALSVVPALLAMPPGDYVYTHELIGRNWDPTLPIIVLSSLAVDVVLAVLAPAGTTWLFAAAAVLLLGVSVVSHFCNVPINRQVKTVDPEHVPADWHDPRPLWQRYHTLRTVLAILALLVNAIAVVASG